MSGRAIAADRLGRPEQSGRRQRQKADARSAGFDGEQGATLQFGRHLPKGLDDLGAYGAWADIVGADLHDTGLRAAGGGEDRAEVEVAGQDDAAARDRRAMIADSATSPAPTDDQ